MATKKKSAATPAVDEPHFITDLEALADELGATIEITAHLVDLMAREPNKSIALESATRRYVDDLIDICDRLSEHADKAPPIADPLDQWIEITSETLPDHKVHVDVYMPGDDSVERAFYDAEEKVWTDTSHGDTYIVGAITHYRIGSRPPMAKGGM